MLGFLTTSEMYRILHSRVNEETGELVSMDYVPYSLFTEEREIAIDELNEPTMLR